MQSSARSDIIPIPSKNLALTVGPQPQRMQRIGSQPIPGGPKSFSNIEDISLEPKRTHSLSPVCQCRRETAPIIYPSGRNEMHGLSSQRRACTLNRVKACRNEDRKRYFARMSASFATLCADKIYSSGQSLGNMLNEYYYSGCLT